MYLRKPPYLYRKLLSNAVFTAPSEKVFLTFDDGPTPSVTPQVLEYLDKRGQAGTVDITHLGKVDDDLVLLVLYGLVERFFHVRGRVNIYIAHNAIYGYTVLILDFDLHSHLRVCV